MIDAKTRRRVGSGGDRLAWMELLDPLGVTGWRQARSSAPSRGFAATAGGCWPLAAGDGLRYLIGREGGGPSAPGVGTGVAMYERQAKYEQLIQAHQLRLRGFMRSRTRDDALADDLAQETWVEVLRRIDTFDEAKGSFWAFVLIWAKFVLKRHFASTVPEAAHEEGAELGADSRSVNPETALAQARVITELLRRVLACSRPPHEVITFGFSKLKWRPREIVDELCETPLSNLAERLEREYTAMVPSPAIRAAFRPLHARLANRLDALLRDPRTRRAHAGLLQRIAGETALQDYLPADSSAEEAVVWWWGFVKRAVLTELQAAGTGDLLEWIGMGPSHG